MNNNNIKFIINIYSKEVIKIDYNNSNSITYFTKEDFLCELKCLKRNRHLAVAFCECVQAGYTFKIITVVDLINYINNN